MLFSKLRGKEIIDKNGTAVGVVKDISFSSKGQVTHLIALPEGFISKAVGGDITVNFSDVDSIEDIVMLSITKEQLK